MTSGADGCQHHAVLPSFSRAQADGVRGAPTTRSCRVSSDAHADRHSSSWNADCWAGRFPRIGRLRLRAIVQLGRRCRTAPQHPLRRGGAAGARVRGASARCRSDARSVRWGRWVRDRMGCRVPAAESAAGEETKWTARVGSGCVGRRAREVLGWVWEWIGC
jgi:hypothetical protein